MPLRRVVFALGAAVAAGLSVQDARHTLNLLAAQDTAVPATDATSSTLPFKPSDPSTCTSIVAATTDAWCVSTCANSCPPQQCTCEGDQAPLVPESSPLDVEGAKAEVVKAAKASAQAAAAARTEAEAKASAAASSATSDIEAATAVKVSNAGPLAVDSSTAQLAFKPADASTCKSIVAATTDAWCVSTCANACPPQQCECEGEQAPVVAKASPPEPDASPVPGGVGTKEYLCQVHGQCDQPTQPAAVVPAGVDPPTGEASQLNRPPTAEEMDAANEAAAAAAAAAAKAAADAAAKANAPATESSSAQRAFKPTDAGSCYSIVESTTDAWCISTCEDACPPQICACDSDSGPVQAISATPIPAMSPKPLPKWAAEGSAKAFKPIDPDSCLSIAPGTTDSWCVSTCANMCPPQMCVCDAGAKNASAMKKEREDAVAPAAKLPPHYANGSPKPPKWVGDPRNFNGGNMNCISLDPSTSDQWCQLNCASKTGTHDEVSCPEDLCKCDAEAREMREQQHDETMDNWKEAEARVRSAENSDDRFGGFPDGLPPAADDAIPELAAPGAPADSKTCKAVTAPATDVWCRRVCETGVCPRAKCKCDGMKDEDYSDSADNAHFEEDPSNLKDKSDPKHNGEPA